MQQLRVIKERDRNVQMSEERVCEDRKSTVRS